MTSRMYLVLLVTIHAPEKNRIVTKIRESSVAVILKTGAQKEVTELV